MSNYIAIRGVTETLQSLLGDQMEMKDAVTVSTGPPDLEIEPKNLRINLYLYKVIENPFLKNQEIPGHGNPTAYGNPPLSLVLYYLITPFPDVDDKSNNYDLIAHEILGDAMRVLHDCPILTDSIQINQGTKLLHSSLQNQFEKVKITLDPLDTEELTKIWMGLTKPYRLSVGYAVSVVQIESEKPKHFARPVKRRRVHLSQHRRPQIDELTVILPSEDKVKMPPSTARIGDTLKVQGINFSGVSAVLVIGEKKLDVSPASDNLISLVIPDEPELQPGVLSIKVCVIKKTEFVEGGYEDRGETTTGENVVTSNELPLMIVPELKKIDPKSGTVNDSLTVEGERLFKEGLQTLVLVGDRSIEVRKPDEGDTWNPPSSTKVEVPLTSLSGLDVGEYPVRIRVNGAESLEDGKEFEFKLLP